MNDWRRQEQASTRWVTVPPFELDRASADHVWVMDDPQDGLSSNYPEKVREWQEREVDREPDSMDMKREADLEREDTEPDLDRDL
jgi:hypothetical protein